jgi:hypothetical protein
MSVVHYVETEKENRENSVMWVPLTMLAVSTVSSVLDMLAMVGLSQLRTHAPKSAATPFES